MPIKRTLEEFRGRISGDIFGIVNGKEVKADAGLQAQVSAFFDVHEATAVKEFDRLYSIVTSCIEDYFSFQAGKPLDVSRDFRVLLKKHKYVLIYTGDEPCGIDSIHIRGKSIWSTIAKTFEFLFKGRVVADFGGIAIVAHSPKLPRLNYDYSVDVFTPEVLRQFIRDNENVFGKDQKFFERITRKAAGVRTQAGVTDVMAELDDVYIKNYDREQLKTVYEIVEFLQDESKSQTPRWRIYRTSPKYYNYHNHLLTITTQQLTHIWGLEGTLSADKKKQDDTKPEAVTLDIMVWDKEKDAVSTFDELFDRLNKKGRAKSIVNSGNGNDYGAFYYASNTGRQYVLALINNIMLNLEAEADNTSFLGENNGNVMHLLDLFFKNMDEKEPSRGLPYLLKPAGWDIIFSQTDDERLRRIGIWRYHSRDSWILGEHVKKSNRFRAVQLKADGLLELKVLAAWELLNNDYGTAAHQANYKDLLYKKFEEDMRDVISRRYLMKRKVEREEDLPKPDRAHIRSSMRVLETYRARIREMVRDEYQRRMSMVFNELCTNADGNLEETIGKLLTYYFMFSYDFPECSLTKVNRRIHNLPYEIGGERGLKVAESLSTQGFKMDVEHIREKLGYSQQQPN